MKRLPLYISLLLEATFVGNHGMYLIAMTTSDAPQSLAPLSDTQRPFWAPKQAESVSLNATMTYLTVTGDLGTC